MPFPAPVGVFKKVGVPILKNVSETVSDALGGGEKTAESAGTQREANGISGRQNDITSERDRRENNRGDRITQHEIDQDNRQNRVDDEHRNRQDRFEDEDRDVLRKQRQRDETKLQTSDNNDFIIRADFINKAGAVLKKITFGEYNIMIASGITKDRRDLDPGGRVSRMSLASASPMDPTWEFEVRVFETGTLVLNGSLERDGFYIWLKPQKKKAAPTKTLPAAGAPQVACPI